VLESILGKGRRKTSETFGFLVRLPALCTLRQISRHLPKIGVNIEAAPIKPGPVARRRNSPAPHLFRYPQTRKGCRVVSINGVPFSQELLRGTLVRPLETANPSEFDNRRNSLEAGYG